MEEEEVGPTEEIVQALLESMVEPLLGRNSKEVPTLDQQKSMAKQVDAVVLLYNYYYRKQHQDHKLEFLSFTSFCQLAVVLKPSLMTYMKLMHRSDYTDVDDLESQLSFTEKAIMRACDVSLTLDDAEVVQLSQKWPTSKVAVFLVDSRRENCLLMHSSMTCAVWSIIEKRFDGSSGHPSDSKCINKKRRASKIFSTVLQYSDGAALQELALSAAAEATGINRSDLVVLESHLVYAVDKEKASALLYLVQSTKLVNEDFTIPIRDVIESLQGPLIKKKTSGWSVAPAVEYFHLLPYREILSNWHSRELLSTGLQDLNVKVLAGHAYDVHLGSSEKETNQENVAQTMIKTCNTDYDDEKIVEAKRRRGVQGVSAVGLSQLGFQHSEDAVATLDSKEYAISQSALAVLRWKREKLHYQLRILEDEIALCNKTILTEFNGGENELKIEALIDGCNNMRVKGEGVGDSANQLVEDKCIVLDSKGKRLSEAILTLQNQCQAR
ncbi:putative telomere repeat-binding factor 4-like [Capsicum annuum]|nr:putative telomere repeat-binding factor 4-like [Capsicum annuum]KAF3649501.1 putative telomere repeat-binding factor 4-like [Capsicum annuum]